MVTRSGNEPGMTDPEGSSEVFADAPHEVEPISPETQSAADTATFVVLAVLSSPAETDLVRFQLSRPPRTMVVEHAASLSSAVDRIAAGGVDIVLLDLFLLDSSGLSTFQRMYDRSPEIPVVLVVDPGREDLALQALAQGAQGFVVRHEMDPTQLKRSLVASVERQRALRGIRRRAERFSLALDGTNDGLWDWDLMSDTVYYSPRWNGLIGLPERDVVAGSQYWFERIHPEDLPGLKDMLVEHLSGAARHFEYEHRILGSGGDYLWVLTRGLAIRDLNRRARRMAGSMTDITARKQVEERLAFSALHDGLTGLANRALFSDRLGVSLGTLKRDGGPHFGVLFLDLDRFKQVNDTYGHSVGDRLLVEIAQRLKGFLRPGDTLARLGGDEFAVLVANVSGVSGALHVAERVQELLNMPFAVEGHQFDVSASIGIALSTTGYEEPDEILHDADIAMYRAKAAGRGQAQVFDPLMHRSAVALLRLESELRKAVERHEFVMHYQPVVSLEQGRLVGFEALVRWQHPERGLLKPAQFLAVADETGLVTPIGWWAMDHVCRQLVEWQQRYPMDPPLWGSMNISDRFFMQVDLVQGTRSILADTGLDPSALRIELREEVIVRHGEPALDKLDELRQIGVRLAVDDFGSGVSCLSFLERFKYDTLKIDPSYISALGGGTATMIESILTLANGFGIGVIAEGVETADQARRLQQLQCPEGQGFWFAHPVEPAGAEQLLESAPARWALGSQAH
jgi:diguanylate cyclase (GGDEF)-like protein/PAS domain S-box-containing protein